MKKKRCTIIAVIILLAAALLAVWYFLPTTFLKGVASSDVTLISVFDGNTGESFEICDADEIRCIVENIQNTKIEKRQTFSELYRLQLPHEILQRNRKRTRQLYPEQRKHHSQRPIFLPL